jgi:hypothetical protein
LHVTADCTVGVIPEQMTVLTTELVCCFGAQRLFAVCREDSEWLDSESFLRTFCTLFMLLFNFVNCVFLLLGYSYIFLFLCKVKGKVHPKTGHEGPEG